MFLHENLFLPCKRAPTMKALLAKIGYPMSHFEWYTPLFSELLRLISRETTDLCLPIILAMELWLCPWFNNTEIAYLCSGVKCFFFFILQHESKTFCPKDRRARPSIFFTWCCIYYLNLHCCFFSIFSLFLKKYYLLWRLMLIIKVNMLNFWLSLSISKYLYRYIKCLLNAC